MAFEVARACRLPLDILVVRKLGAPGAEELAMGAIASGGFLVLNDDLLRRFHVTEKKLKQTIEQETREMERRERLYRSGRSPIEVAGRTAILVDDGLATGASMRVAIRAVSDRARRVIVAVPVGAESTCVELARLADRVICALNPEPLDAVSLFYREFAPTSDEEVKALLQQVPDFSD